MSRPAVVFDGVWKKFRRGERHDSLRDLIPAATARMLGRRGQPPTSSSEKEFWAVHDVSFEVGPGEALGIIGPNGAGKSTILKLLSRILRPTRGTCEVRGRAGALIEVAAGFHPDLTGRENVFLQGAIMGMKRAEIARKFDEIVEFAGRRRVHRHAGQALLVGHERAPRIRHRGASGPGRPADRRSAERRRRRIPGSLRGPDARADRAAASPSSSSRTTFRRFSSCARARSWSITAL